MSSTPTWPTPEALDHLELTLVDQDRRVTLARAGAAPAREGSIDTPPPQITERHRGAALLLQGIKAVIRVMVKVLYLFPVLLVAKLVLLLMDNPAGDMITVAFVGLVVVFFLVFALLFLVYPLAGPPSRRKPVPRLALFEAGDLDGAAQRAGYDRVASTSPHRLAELCEPDAVEQEPVRLAGRVVPTAQQDAGDAVLRDCWLMKGDVVMRMMAGGSFTVCAEGAPPVVVSLEGAVHLVLAGTFSTSGLGQLDTLDLGQHEAWLRKQAEMSVVDLAASARCCSLRVGDEVELLGGRYSPIARINDHSTRGRRLAPLQRDRAEGSPYRGDGTTPGLELRSDEGAPLVVVVR